MRHTLSTSLLKITLLLISKFSEHFLLIILLLLPHHLTNQKYPCSELFQMLTLLPFPRHPILLLPLRQQNSRQHQIWFLSLHSRTTTTMQIIIPLLFFLSISLVLRQVG